MSHKRNLRRPEYTVALSAKVVGNPFNVHAVLTLYREDVKLTWHIFRVNAK